MGEFSSWLIAKMTVRVKYEYTKHKDTHTRAQARARTHRQCKICMNRYVDRQIDKQTDRQTRHITLNTAVLSLKVTLEVLRTVSLGGVQPLVRNPDRATVATRADDVSDVKDVLLTANEAVILLHTSAKPHPTIASPVHHNNIIGTTTGSKLLILAKF